MVFDGETLEFPNDWLLRRLLETLLLGKSPLSVLSAMPISGCIFHHIPLWSQTGPYNQSGNEASPTVRRQFFRDNFSAF